MESEELPTTDNRYGVRLKIKSEEDLFVIDEATGAKKYKYPPEGAKKALETVMRQCDHWADDEENVA